MGDTRRERSSWRYPQDLGDSLGKGRDIGQAHIIGYSLSIRVLHKEDAFADRQPDHMLHLPAQGVVNSYLELQQEGQSHSRPPNPSSHIVLAFQDKPRPL